VASPCRITAKRLRRPRRNAGAQATTPVNATRANVGLRRGNQGSTCRIAARRLPYVAVPTSRRLDRWQHAPISARERDSGERRDAWAAWPAPTGSRLRCPRRDAPSRSTCRIAATLPTSRRPVTQPLPDHGQAADVHRRGRSCGHPAARDHGRRWRRHLPACGQAATLTGGHRPQRPCTRHGRATGRHLPDFGQAARVETSHDAHDVLNWDVVKEVRR
jgi:hypothetical protein